MSISTYSRISEQPGTARQIVALGIAFAIVVVGLIAFNLTLERVSLLDDLKKDVQALALVHRNHAEREIREYDGLLRAAGRPGPSGRPAWRPDQRNASPSIRPWWKAVFSALRRGAGNRLPVGDRPYSRRTGMPGLLMDAAARHRRGTRILIARRLDPA